MATCKFCQSADVVKHGMKGNLQRYLCKECGHHFVDNGNELPRMRVNQHIVVAAMNLYFEGLSVRKVQRQLRDILGEEVNQGTIWIWVQKFSALAAEYARTLTPTVSGKIHHDETVVKIDGSNRWFWEAIDEETRFLVASYLSNSRSLAETYQQFKRIKEGCNPQPNAIFVDGSNTYDDAFRFAFGNPNKVSQPELVKRVGIRARETNNIVERLHGSLKDRTKPMRGLKSKATAQALLDGWVTHYNFCREHQSIKMTPAQAAGIEVKGWKNLIRLATTEKTKQEKIAGHAMELVVRA
ncbi:MAG: IS6 family transposase [Thaumarchaeota archaeon]|nr:IS6 family transposase [Nitrososphaerota archaeon]MCL5317539.1 IS6 family transposase [Nitrososphaerota archaeon]